MKSFDDYQQFAEQYIKQTELSSHNAYYERPAMFSILSNLKFKRVLDAGCTGGIYGEWLLNNGADLVAINSMGLCDKRKKLVVNFKIIWRNLY